MDELIEKLKIYFATNFQYWVKSHGYHVNIIGPDFYQYHILLEKVYSDAQENIDTIAEKIRTLDSIVPFNTRRIEELSRIEPVENIPGALAMIGELVDDTEILLDTIRDAHEAADECDCWGILNYLEARLDDHSKLLWMLKSTVR